MARQFWLRLLNEDFFTTRAWPDLLSGIFGDSPVVRALSRFDFLVPATAPAPTESSPPQESQFLAPVPTALPEPESAPIPRPEAAPFVTGGFPLVTFGAPIAEAPGGIAIMSAPIRPGSSAAVASQAGVAQSGGPYQILFSEDLGPGLVVDPATRQILTGGAQDPELGTGDGDTLVLSGPLAAGLTLPVGLHGLESVVLQPGASYDLVSLDDHVAAGATLTINALPLGPGETAAFDGSAESDGSFVFLGGGGDDLFRGGAGDDLIFGDDGGDELSGGGGADVFGYGDAAESSGAGYDSLVDFDPAEDRIDLPVAVSGFDAAVQSGDLSTASFDTDLAAALGASGPGAGRAVLFAPDSGDLAGTIFLIVDGNGEAGYQAGEDYVFALPAADLADLSANTGFFV